MPEFSDPSAYNRWRELLAQRREPGAEQEVLGPFEHGAYAESRVREHPLYGVVEQLGAVPGYTLAKALRLQSGRSPASVDEMAEGYRGIGRGVAANIGDLLDSLSLGHQPRAAKPSTGPAPLSQRMAEQGMLSSWLRRMRED